MNKFCRECPIKMAGETSHAYSYRGEVNFHEEPNGMCKLINDSAPSDIEQCQFMQDYKDLFAPHQCRNCAQLTIRDHEWIECYNTGCVFFGQFEDSQSANLKQDKCEHNNKHGFITIQDRVYYVCLECHYIMFNKFKER